MFFIRIIYKNYNKMTLNENKLKKGKKLNKKYKNRKKLGSIKYNNDSDKSIILDHNLQIKAMMEYESKIEKKHAKKTHKKQKKKIKFEKKKDLMEELLLPVPEKIKEKDDQMIIEDLENKPENKKQKSKKNETKTIKIQEIKQEGGMKDINKKKIFITADLKPEAKKGELIL